MRIVIAAILTLVLNSIGFCQDKPFETAKWISAGRLQNQNKNPCLVFRKKFTTHHDQAKLYITAMGVYEAYLNGKRIGNDYFNPGFTVYNKRLQYQVYEVGDLLKKGTENVLEVMVGEGWYKGVFRNLKTDTARNNFGNELGLLAELVANNDDKNSFNSSGETTILNSDSSWQWAETGIRYSEFYDGEFADTRWMQREWGQVKLLERDKGMLVPSAAEPVRKQEVFKPVRMIMTPKGEQVIDFGQNMAGWVQLELKGKAGDTIVLQHAETLDGSGDFYTGNLRTANATDTYVLNGKKQLLEPHFTYHGFRYALLRGIDMEKVKFRAVALYSDLKKTGTFECSDPMLNRLQQNIEWSMKSNFVDIPTDCPQRSERLGWTGDAQVFTATASYLRNTRLFYSKWLEDVASEQARTGAIPNFVPTSSAYHERFNGVAGWGDAATMIPWRLYEVYGDTALLEKNYGLMKGWVNYIHSASKDHLFKNKGFGDWYAMGDSTSIPYINQCFYVHSVELLLKAAQVLGRLKDVDAYGQLLAQVKRAFITTYVDKRQPNTDTQTAYALALAFGMLPDHLNQIYADRLAALVRKNENKLATGFLGTPYLLKALSDYGHANMAYQLLLQKECPSWLYPLTKDATTIWERWDAIKPDGSLQATSFNHYAYGAVGQWMYENIAGICVATPGYRKVVIKPLIGGGLTWAKGSYESGYGKISVRWKIDPHPLQKQRLQGKERKVMLDIDLPSGTTAEVWVPGEATHRTVTSGRHFFTGKVIP